MANAKQTAPYGTWKSPLNAEALAGSKLSFSGIRTNPLTRQIYILESRPSEAGRSCIVEYTPSASASASAERSWTARDVLPTSYSAGTKVHEYGGGAFAVSPDGSVVFSDAGKRGVFWLEPGSSEVSTVVSHVDEDVRYADFHCGAGGRWVLATREDHREEPCENCVVAIDRVGGEVVSVAGGADFYQHAQFSPDGKMVCWVQWSHPHMSWRGTRLFVADWEDGKVGEARHVAGEEGKISVSEVRWGFDGSLYFVSDNTGWWQLYRLASGSSRPQHIKLDGLEEVDVGSRGHMGNCTWHPLTAETLLVTITRKATQSLITVRPGESTYSTLTTEITYVDKEAIARLSDTEIAIIGCSPTSAEAAYILDTERGSLTTLKTTLPLTTFPDLSADHISTATHISFPRRSGAHQQGTAHAFYAAPKNPSFTAPHDTKPPCIIWCHGGPHHNYASGLDLTAQYFTSRGYAYVGVNHAGSIGYGRAYRELLYGNWGLLDGADCASCVRYLGEQGLIDERRVGIVGQSAGGYAVLQGLCEYADVYAGGVSNYGISSLEALMRDTHKFESRYCQELIFERGMTAEQRSEVVRRRSPYLNAEKIRAPLLLLQGDADAVVPPNQASMMEEIMKKQGRKVEVVIFEGEGHGFKRKESIKTALELQEEWWKQTLLKD